MHVEMPEFWPEPHSPKSSADKFDPAGGRSLRARISWVEVVRSTLFCQTLRQSRGAGANLCANGTFANFHVFKRPQWASGTPPRCRAYSAYHFYRGIAFWGVDSIVVFWFRSSIVDVANFGVCTIQCSWSTLSLPDGILSWRVFRTPLVHRTRPHTFALPSKQYFSKPGASKRSR